MYFFSYFFLLNKDTSLKDQHTLDKSWVAQRANVVITNSKGCNNPHLRNANHEKSSETEAETENSFLQN